jgi:uncharacterized OB-fold protein
VPEARRGVYPSSLLDPFSDAMTEPFWEAARQGKLVAARCTNCGTYRMPPGPFCFNCQHRDVVFDELPGTGVIYSFTVVRHPLRPDLVEAVPYVSAVINLDGTQGAGARMLANVVDCDPEKVKIGDPVRIAFDSVSDTYPVPRFKPA